MLWYMDSIEGCCMIGACGARKCYVAWWLMWSKLTVTGVGFVSRIVVMFAVCRLRYAMKYDNCNEY